MDILVTGGTGFIGQKLVKRLLSHNHHVSVLVRETSDTSVLPDAVKLEKGNLLDRESLDEIVKDNGIVFHLAAYFDFYPSDTDLMYRVNVDGTRMLAEACAEASVSQFIYSSSTEAIGPVNNPPADEETEPQPAFDYGKSKVLAEEAVREVSANTGLIHTIVRPTGVMGEGDFYTAYETIRALNKEEVPVLPGDGEKHIMYTHVDDVTRGFEAAMVPAANNETIIVCPDEPMKYNELIEYISDILGVEPPKRHVPTALAKLGIALMSPFKNWKENTFLWHPQTIQSMDEERWYSNEKAKRLLDWEPQMTMEEGLKRAIDWYYENGYLERRG